MSAVATAGPHAAERPDVAVFRDDGPLAGLLGRVAAGRVPPLLLLLAGLAPLIAAIALRGGDASTALAGAVIAWLVLCGGLSSGTLPLVRRRWALPVLVRLGEYMTLVWIAAIAGPSTYPAAYALLAALAFRHYDLVYRLRHRGEVPPRWLNLLAAGWEGRLLIAYVLLLAAALPAGFYVWAALLAVVSVAETVAAWRRYERGSSIPSTYEDEMDDD